MNYETDQIDMMNEQELRIELRSLVRKLAEQQIMLMKFDSIGLAICALASNSQIEDGHDGWALHVGNLRKLINNGVDAEELAKLLAEAKSEDMKLFVVGEVSCNPEDWGIWSEWSLVIAETMEQALEMTGETIATELPMDKAMVVCKMPEPSWGDDI